MESDDGFSVGRSNNVICCDAVTGCCGIYRTGRFLAEVPGWGSASGRWAAGCIAAQMAEAVSRPGG